MFEKQSQSVEHSSTAIQAGGHVVVINAGISAGEARQISLDVFRANLMEFRGEAIAIAKQRGEEITEKFFEKLIRENTAGLNQARSPDFQDAMFAVQKEYSKAGDEELGDLLVDLLVDRTKEESRSILQIVLNESINTAPKLTSAQTATLSIIFFLRYVRWSNGVENIKHLVEKITGAVRPLASTFSTSNSTFNHLAFTGCGSSLPMVQTLENIFAQTYPGLFTLGFDKATLDAADISAAAASEMVMPCLNDPTRYQVAALNKDVFESKVLSCSLGEDEKGRLLALCGEGVMPHDVVRAKLLEQAPFLDCVFAS